MGFREFGMRKAKLFLKIQKLLNSAEKKGINTKYIMRKFLDYNHPNDYTTKQYTGLISQLSLLIKQL